MMTTDNERFLRFFWEIDRSRIGFDYTDSDEAVKSGTKWFPYNKGDHFENGLEMEN